MLPLIIQLVSGAVGGNLVGSVMKNFNLGPMGNSLAGIVGGGLGGQLLTMAGAGGLAGAAGGGLDVASILSSVASGGAGGGVVMVVIGLIKNMVAK